MGVVVTCGATPVPVSGTVCEEGTALSIKTSEALSAAAVEGVNVISTSQVPLLGATGAPTAQLVSEITKSAAFAPVIAGGALKPRGACPVFVRVTVMEPLTNCPIFPNGTLAGRLT